MDIAAIFADPRIMLFRVHGEAAFFVPMTRESYARSIFFDKRLQPAEQRFIQVPVEDLISHLDEVGFTPPRIRFIHHFAHSGSTLMARALDHPGNLVIREPAHLRQIGVGVGAGPLGPAAPRKNSRLALSLTMLGKRFSRDSTLIVKGNVPISLLAEKIAALDPGQPAILLYLPLADYCAAVLRTPQHQLWVNRVTAEIALSRDPLIGDIGGLAVAERAGALWYSMIKRFERLLVRHSEMRSLDANLLYAYSAETVVAASNCLEAGLTPEDAGRLIAGPLFSTYSKNPNVPFDSSARRKRNDETKARLAHELRLARSWVEKRAAESALPQSLDRPLTGTGTRLL